MDFLQPLFGEEALTFAQFTEKLQAQTGIKLANLASGEYVSQSKYADLETANSALQTQLSEANDTIKGYQDMDIDSIKQSATEWETKYNQAIADAQAADARRAMEAAVSDLKFTSQGAKRAFLEDLQKQNLPLQEGKLLGLTDFVDGYRKNDPDAFVVDGGKPQFATGGKPAAPATEVTLEAFKAMGYADRLKLKTEQPETYQALAGTKG